MLTEAVAHKLGDGAPVEPLGVRVLRGAQRPVALYRLSSREEKRDPVCGRIVDEPPAARLRHGDDELWFCSQDCLRTFLGTARAAF